MIVVKTTSMMMKLKQVSKPKSLNDPPQHPKTKSFVLGGSKTAASRPITAAPLRTTKDPPAAAR
jgi:hypothetical protein